MVRIFFLMISGAWAELKQLPFLKYLAQVLRQQSILKGFLETSLFCLPLSRTHQYVVLYAFLI